MMVDGLVGYLVNAAWQAPLLAAGAWTLARVSHLGPRGRNRVWLACLGLSVVLPMADLVATDGPAGSKTSAVAATTIAHAMALTLDDRLAMALIAVFAGALMVGVGRLLLGWLAVRRLVRDAEEVTLAPAIAAELAAVAAAHGASMPRIKQSGGTSSAVVAGAFRPVILIPVNLVERPEDELRAALQHELAHVIRRDYAINLLSEIATLPLFWHPVLHTIKAEVRRSRELVCDAMAAAAMHSETVYARSLVALAKALDAPTSRGAPAIVGLFEKPLLEERLMHLIGPKRTPGPTLKIVGLVGGGLVAAGAVSAAVLLHVPTVRAQPADPAVATQPDQETPAEARTRMKVMQLIDDPRTRKQIVSAEKELAKAQSEADSPAFRARAKAAVLKALADPETQAELARANRLERTPEVRKAGQDLHAAAMRLRVLDHAEKP